ncbi:MAG: C2 family cysteine protease [Candidatus Sericytochromatia bacterium]
MNIGIHRLTPSPAPSGPLPNAAHPPVAPAATPPVTPATAPPPAHPHSASQAQTAALRNLTAPQLPEAVMAQAQEQGADQIQQVAARPGVLAWLKASSLGHFFAKHFASPPPPLDAHGTLHLPEGVLAEEVQDPGIKGKFAHHTRVYKTNPAERDGAVAPGDFFEASKGEHCTYRRTEHAGIFAVEKYHRDDNDNLVFDFKGYVYARDLSSHFQARSHKALEKDAPLFPHPPSVHDIKQGAIGDCYFMAGLAGIVAQKPEAVKNMIRDNGNGTVTVKLFDVKEVDGHKTFAPKYLTFDKSVLHTDFAIREHASKDAPWIALLEKAYAIHTGSYARMGEGGFASDVFETLLGQPAIKQEIQSQPLKAALIKAFTLPSTAEQAADPQLQQLALFLKSMVPQGQALLAEAETGGLTREAIQALVTTQAPVNLGDPQTLNAIRTALRAEKLETPGLIPSLVNAFRGLPALDNREAVIAALKRVVPPLSEAVQACILKQATPIGLSPENQTRLLSQLEPEISGPRGSGAYARSQLALFNQIQTDLAAGKPMGTGSRHTLAAEDGEASGVGTAGEEVVHGLVGGHDFAITGALELHPGDRGYPGPADGPPLRFVRLRNPWGDMSPTLSALLNATGALSYGAREYRFNRETGKLEAHATHGAEYLCELSDFTRNFEHIYSA